MSWAFSPRLDDLVRDVPHGFDIRVEPLIRLPVCPFGEDARSVVSTSTLGKKVSHGSDERVHVVSVKRVEAVIHGTQGECVEC